MAIRHDRRALRRGLSLARGGRFWHLFSGSDKGHAVRELTKLYRQSEHIRFRSIGLGDSPNDSPLLSAVDRPVLLPGPGGKFSPEVLSKLPHVARADAPGPAGCSPFGKIIIATPRCFASSRADGVMIAPAPTCSSPASGISDSVTTGLI